MVAEFLTDAKRLSAAALFLLAVAGCGQPGGRMTGPDLTQSEFPFTASPKFFVDYVDTSGNGDYLPFGTTEEQVLDTVLLAGQPAILVLEQTRGSDSTVLTRDTVRYSVTDGDLYLYLSGIEDFASGIDSLGSITTTNGFTEGWYPLLMPSAGTGGIYSILATSFQMTLQSDSLSGGSPLTLNVDVNAWGTDEKQEQVEVQQKTYQTTVYTISIQLTLRVGFIVLPQKPTLVVTYWTSPGSGVVMRESQPVTVDLSSAGLSPFTIPGTRRELLPQG